LNSSDQVEKIQ